MADELDLDGLEALAKAATPISTDLYGDRYFHGVWSCAEMTKEQDAFIAAFNPDTVLKLIAAARSRGVGEASLALTEARRQNLELVIARLEQIVATEGEFADNLVDLAKDALPCARAVMEAFEQSSMAGAAKGGNTKEVV